MTRLNVRENDPGGGKHTSKKHPPAHGKQKAHNAASINKTATNPRRSLVNKKQKTRFRKKIKTKA